MSLFDDLFSDLGAPLLADELGGETWSYWAETPGGTRGGAPQPITVIEEAERTVEESVESGRSQLRTRVIKIVRRGSPFEAGPPSLGAKFAKGDLEYALESIQSITPSMIELVLVRRGAIEKSRPGYRARK
ncbi:MAG: hypothetical protein ACOY3Y_01665 [Acidobacteriota bacterium]